MIDLSNVTAIALGADDVLEIQDSLGTVLWQKTVNYNVNISAGSNGSVSVNGTSGNYSQSVPSGTILTIQGTGDSGYDFDGWSDGISDNPRTITVTSDLTLTASFVAVIPDINVTITNTSNYSGATYQIDDGTVEPINETGTTSFIISPSATTLTVNRNGKGVTEMNGVQGITSTTDWVADIPVNKMSTNVSIDLVSLM